MIKIPLWVMETPLNAALWTPDCRRIPTLLKTKYKSSSELCKRAKQNISLWLQVIWAWPIYLSLVPGWLTTCSDEELQDLSVPERWKGWFWSSVQLPSRVSTAVGCVCQRWMLLYPEGDSIQLLLLLARMGKGSITEYHKGLYGEGRSWTWRTWLLIMNVHQCVYHQPATLQTGILFLEVQTHRFCCLPGPFPSL